MANDKTIDQFGMEDEFAQQAAATEGMPAKVDEPPAEPAAKEPAKFRREIDLADGSGVQVFEGDTADELIEKLTQAQFNATKKIRELSRRSSKPRKPADTAASATRPAVPSLTPEQWAALGSDLYLQPQKALPAMIEASLGMSLDDVRDAVAVSQEVKTAAQRQEAIEDFVISTESYHPSPKNYREMMRHMRDEDLEITADNMRATFEELSASGLLESPPAPKADAAVEPKTVAQPKKASTTGLSGRKAPASDTQASALPSADELDKLSVNEARDRIAAALRQHGASTQR